MSSEKHKKPQKKHFGCLASSLIIGGATLGMLVLGIGLGQGWKNGWPDSQRPRRVDRGGAVNRQESQALLQSKLDAYIAVLEAGKVSVVRRVGVEQNGNIWTAILTVDNVWHMKLYQIRLQDAQTLWKAWASIASPNDPDLARISIVDLHGNEVGGSRVWGGSLIWVQEQ